MITNEQKKRISEVATATLRGELEYLIGYMVYQKSEKRWMVDADSMELSFASGYIAAKLDFAVSIASISVRVSPIMMELACELAEKRSK